VCSCIRGLFWRKCSLNDCTVLYLSESDYWNILKLPRALITQTLFRFLSLVDHVTSLLQM
jgi:hypothetical protein